MATRGRQTIVQRIALDGGKEIERELATLGAVGTAAFRKLQEAVRAQEGPMGQFNHSLNLLRQTMGNVSTASAAFTTAFSKAAKQTAILTGAVALATAGLVKLVKSSLDASEKASETAQRVGLAVPEYNRLAAISKLAGVESETFAKALTKIQLAINGATDNFKGALPVIGQFFSFIDKGATRAVLVTAENFEELKRRAMGVFRDTTPVVGEFFTFIEKGVRRAVLVTEDNLKQMIQIFTQQQKQLGKEIDPVVEALGQIGIMARRARDQGRPLVDLLDDIADHFKSLPDGAEKTALAVKLFGERIGPKLIPFLNQGRAGIAKVRKDLEDLGIGTALDSTNSEVAEKFNDLVDTIQLGVSQLKTDFSVALANALTGPLEAVLQSLKDSRIDIKNNLAALASDIGTFLKSVIGAFVGARDQAGNFKFINEDQVAEQHKFLIGLRDAILSTFKFVKALFSNILIPAFNAVRSAADQVAKVINLVFGTELTGGALLFVLVLGKVTGAFRLLGAGIGVIMSLFGLFISILKVVNNGLKLIFLAKPASGLITAVSSVLEKVKAMGGAASAAATFFTRFGVIAGGALRIVLGLIAAIIGWPAVLIAGIALIAVYWKEVTAFAREAFTKIKTMVAGIWDGFLLVAADFWEGVQRIARDAWAGIKKIVSDFWDGLMAIPQAFWDGAVKMAQDAWAQIQKVASDIWVAVEGVASGIWRGIERVGSGIWKGIQNAAISTFNAIASAATTILSPIFNILESIGSRVAAAIANVFTGTTNGIIAAAQVIKESIQKAIDISGEIASQEKLAKQLAAPFEKAAAEIGVIISTKIPQIVQQGAQQFGQILVQAFANAAFRVVGIVNQMADDIEQAMARIVRAAEAAKRAIEAVPSGGGAAAGGGGLGPQFARGGPVYGPGTGTSDSIPAWLSSGEFVIRAAAVKRYGASFLSAINGMRLGARSMKMGLPRFAMGGLVDSAMRFPNLDHLASPVLPGKTFDIHLGGETFQNLYAPEETASRLEAFLMAQQARQAGRKPAWYGGTR